MHKEDLQDIAMSKFSDKHHIWEVLRSLMIVVNVQNRENREIGDYLRNMHVSGNPPYFFKIDAQERAVMMRAKSVYSDFMKLDKRVHYILENMSEDVDLNDEHLWKGDIYGEKTSS